MTTKKKEIDRRRFLLSAIAVGTIPTAGCSSLQDSVASETGPDQFNEKHTTENTDGIDTTAFSDTQSTTNAKPEVNTSWKEGGYNAKNTRYNPEANGPKDQIREKWGLDLGGEQEVTFQPIVYSDTVFATANETLFAVSTSTGEIQWQSGPNSGHPATNGKSIFISDGSDVYAVSSSDGEQQWHFQVNGLLYDGPTLENKSVYIPGVRVISPDRGAKIEEYDIGGMRLAVTEDRLYAVQGTYSTGKTNYVSSYELPSGSEEWRFKPEDDIISLDQPVVGDSRVYVGAQKHDTDQGRLIALSQSDGEEVWSIADKGYFQSPVLAEDTLYSASYSSDRNGKMYAIGASEGNIKWEFEGVGAVYNPIMGGEILYLGDEAGNVYALNPTNGEEYWSYTVTGAVGGMSVAGENLYVITVEGNLYSLSE